MPWEIAYRRQKKKWKIQSHWQEKVFYELKAPTLVISVGKFRCSRQEVAYERWSHLKVRMLLFWYMYFPYCKQVAQGWNWLILLNIDHPSLIFGQAIPELELFLFGCFLQKESVGLLCCYGYLGTCCEHRKESKKTTNGSFYYYFIKLYFSIVSKHQYLFLATI